MKLESSGQLTLPIEFLREPDRNFEKGGRSFYFFDFDDNIIHLPTTIVLMDTSTGQEKSISTQQYAEISNQVGQPGPWQNFKLNPAASYRNFREQPQRGLNDQPLIEDMREALAHPFVEWRGPSWEFFVHAVNNNRPIAVITARGHHPHTIRRAIDMLVLSRDLSSHPNYLSVYPVTYPEVLDRLSQGESNLSIGELKRRAIHRAVEDAFECYGPNPHHRFGMSDDDPVNVALIRQAMSELKQKHPENAFFVINTHGRQLHKEEIFVAHGSGEDRGQTENQVDLFSDT
jgi:hypothetical protein